MHKLTPPPKHGIIGHRGTAGLRPENTYVSFKHAAELGLNWIEFDVQLTKDHQWVVMHDDTIERTTTGQGRIQDYTLSQLQNFEAGLWYTPPYKSEPIPTLKETIALCQSLGLQVNIEIKGSEQDYLMHAQFMYEFLKPYITLTNLPLLSSFDLHCVIALRKLLPSLPISFLIEEFTPDTITICQQHNFTTINCDVEKFTAENLRLATDNNLPVLLYTVNDPAIAKFWLDAGVSAVFTDRADLLLEA